VYKETQWNGPERRVGGNIEHGYNTCVSSSVVFSIPTALHVGDLRDSDKGNLLVVSKLDQEDLFVTDTWTRGRLTVNAGVRWDRYVSWIPEQRQLAFSIGPVSVPDQTFPERTFFTWNSVAPRVGVIYDFNGHGDTVLKASYGRYWYNPGPNIAADANPNQSAKTVTYNWNDRNGDRRYQLGEEGALTDSALAGSIQIDPNITQPYSHDVALYLERQLAPSIGARIGWVYKTEDGLTATYRPYRGLSAYSVPFAFVDVGPDGRANTGDERTLTLRGLPSSQQSQFPTTRVIMNVPQFSRYKTIEASMAKRMSDRWSLQAGGSHTWSRDFPENYPNDPNAPMDERRTRWDFKLSANYQGPWDLKFSPLVRHQAGIDFARQISVGSQSAAAFGLIYSGTIYAEPANARRQDTITVLDVRTERTFTLPRGMRVRGFLDLFNITNSNAAETRTVVTGSSFLRPTAILAPRTARVGVRFTW